MNAARWPRLHADRHRQPDQVFPLRLKGETLGGAGLGHAVGPRRLHDVRDVRQGHGWTAINDEHCRGQAAQRGKGRLMCLNVFHEPADSLSEGRAL